MKSVDAKSSTDIDPGVENNKKDHQLKIGDNVRISKYKTIFAKGCVPNQPEEIFVIKKVKNTVPLRHVMWELNSKYIFGTFCEKELQNTDQT